MTTAPQITAPLTKDRLFNQAWAAWLKTGETSPRSAFLAAFNAVCEIIGLPPQDPPRDIQPEEWAPREATWQLERAEREGYVGYLLQRIDDLQPEKMAELRTANQVFENRIAKLHEENQVLAMEIRELREKEAK